MRSLLFAFLVVVLSFSCGRPPEATEPDSSELAERESALCQCGYFAEYLAPVTVKRCGLSHEGVYTCGPVVEQHRIYCDMSCNACVVTCFDATAGQNTTSPGSAYLISKQNVSCNGLNTCGP